MSERRDHPAQDEHPNYPNSPVCPYCQRRFLNLDDLTLHIVTRHTQSGKTPGPAQAGTTKT